MRGAPVVSAVGSDTRPGGGGGNRDSHTMNNTISPPEVRQNFSKKGI